VRPEVFASTLAAALLLAAPASALPPGRAWTTIDTLKVNGHAYMVPGRFEPLRNGRIELVADGYFGPLDLPYHHQVYGLVWADSAWTIRWTLKQPAYSIWDALTTPDRQMLVWKTTAPPPPDRDASGREVSYLVTTEISPSGDIAPPDTIAAVAVQAYAYSGTAWGSRRWVAVRDADLVNPANLTKLRIFRSDAPRQWREMGPTGMTGFNFMRLAALDSTNVLVLSSDYHTGIRWGMLRDTVFEEHLPRVTADPLALIPGLSRRPSGGFWTAWDAAPDILPYYSDRIVTRRYSEGAWAAPETLQMRWPFDGQHLFYGTWLSAEGSEFPAAAWNGYAPVSPDGYSYVWVEFPSDHAFGIGERIEGSRWAEYACLVRDENGDVWVAWWRLFDGVYWVHSHTTVECSTPQVGERAGRPFLRWSLTGAAPETWWAVLRAQGDGPLERVARVQASADSVMNWADASAPTNVVLHYAIRRECRDVRYQQTSGESVWEPRGPSLELAVRGANPSAAAIEFEVVGANLGPLEARLYDLQGREVARLVMQASGSGRDRASLPLGSGLGQGLYLIRVRSADGRASPSAKVAIVR